MESAGSGPCAATSFSPLATNADGQANCRTSSDIIGSNSNSVEGDQRFSENGDEQECSKKKLFYNLEHPLHVAATAMLNVAASNDDYNHEKLSWNSKIEQEAPTRISLITLNPEAFARQHLSPGGHQQQDLGNSDAVDPQQSPQRNRHHSNHVGVVRLAGSSSVGVKMEYPHHDDTNGAGPVGVMTSSNGHHDQVMHSQHVEVIKTAGHVQPLHMDDQHLHHQQNHSPKDMDNANMLQVLYEQEMKNMRMPVYDHYQARPGAIYGQMTAAGVYDSLAPSAPTPYGGLNALQQSQHILQPTYANLLASGQEYYQSNYEAATDYYSRIRPLHTGETPQDVIDRLNRQAQPIAAFGEKPSPVDSGIGVELMITPKQEIHDGQFMYSDLHNSIIQQTFQQQQRVVVKECVSPTRSSSNERVATHRESPVHIPKIDSSVGFQYTFESPISTSVRREDDRLTYINKGQFYTVTMDYIHDSQKPLKSMTVKSIMLVVFRDDKSYEEETKCWQFWHGHQHSLKQRILDVDAKNSGGIVGPVEEIAHNAVAFYWNPTEQPAKLNVAVQCLSTDFSNQKGVKGLPLHLQIDTYDEAYNKNTPFHRGYCQIKVFCDKGANRKMLHEQRRDEKRRMQGRKKTDGEYWENCERSEFYHMSNLTKRAVLFAPPDDFDRQNLQTIDTYYTNMDDNNAAPMSQHGGKDENNGVTSGAESGCSPPVKKRKVHYTNRVMIYVRKADEHVFTPLHLAPPNVDSVAKSIGEKYNLDKNRITGVFKQSSNGFTVKMDDDMVRHYCDEDSFLVQFDTNDDGATYRITLAALDAVYSSACSSPN